ncbi:phage portal protein [Sphingobium baderi]|uniref:Phage portal protein n=1 Tax=Sphingobium baderi TaxID=1332080 RepID=A0A0S3F2X9_9SPHN|nr:phage portal protein [Sphingobium baderi]ALR22073.1 phage portal protein [Sphingobium baderi]
MVLKDWLARITGFEKRNDSADPSWAALAPGIGYMAGVSARAAENLSTVLACTNAIATALAYVPALVYRVDSDGNRVEAMSHPLRRIARGGANPQMTWPDWLEHLVASALLTGNGLAEIIRAGNGQLSGFRWIPWGMVTVVYLSSGRLAYDVTDGRGGTRRLLESEVLHLRDRTDDGLVGRSRLSRAADTVAGVQASNAFAKSFLERGAQPSGVIRHPGAMTLEQKASLREQFNSNYSGAANAGKTLILDGGLEWQAAQISPEDAELLESRKFGVVEVCRLFQVPPPIVQAYENNTFTNASQAGLWFATFCLAPWARKIEAEFARSVFPSNGPYELELDLSGFLRGDPATRWQAHEIALRNNVLDANEVRQIEGWNPRKAEPAGVRSPPPANQGEQSHV